MKSIGQSWQSAKGIDGGNSPRRGKASVMKPSTNGMRAYVAPGMMADVVACQDEPSSGGVVGSKRGGANGLD